MSDEIYDRNHLGDARPRVSPILVWTLTLASLAILAIGLWLQSPWWMLSTPLAIAGAVAAGISRNFFP